MAAPQAAEMQNEQEPIASQQPLLNEPSIRSPSPPPPAAAVPSIWAPSRPTPSTRGSNEQIPVSVSPNRRSYNSGTEMTFWNPSVPAVPNAPARSLTTDSMDLRRAGERRSFPTTGDRASLNIGDRTSFQSIGAYPDIQQPLEDMIVESPQNLTEGEDEITALPQKRHSQQSLQPRQVAHSMRSIRFNNDNRKSYRFENSSDNGSDQGAYHSGDQGSGHESHGPRRPTIGSRRPSTKLQMYMRTEDGNEEILRLPLTWWMNSRAKNHFVATIGEFIGTTLFLFFAFAGTQVANIGAGTTTNTNNGYSPIVLLYISTAFGFSLMVNVWIFFRISGGLFNPAVTLAMTMVKSITYTRAILLVAAQLSGSLLASVLVRALFPTPLNVRTTLSSDTSLVRGVFIEAILTAELVFTIFMLAKEKHKATFMAPVGIGLALFIAELVGVYYTGGSLNPARSFGPCAVTGIWDHDHWIYWLGPAIGAVIAVGFYNFIKILEYEMANPGQDESHESDNEHGFWPSSKSKKDEEA